MTASPRPSPHPNRWLVLLLVSSAVFLITVDMTVLHTALPTLTRALGASASDKLWIVNAYSLVVAGLLPGTGTLGDRVGHKRMLVIGLAFFGAASLVAAFSPTPAVLIGARALLAVGAATMMPATLSIIRLTFTDEKECALAIGLWGAVAAGGSAIGPLIGGVLLEYFWWGSAFLINVPIVAVALAASLVVIPNEKGTSRAPWDFFGSLQILVGLVGVAYAIKEVAMAKPSYPAAATAAVIGTAALAWFARRQRSRASPLIDFGLFADRGFRGAVMAALVSAFAVVGVALVLSQRLQLVLGYTPLGAALFMLPASVMAFVGGPLAGALVPRFGGDRVIMGALLLGGAGVAGLCATANEGIPPQLFFLAAYGLGAGAALAAASHAIMSHASAEHAGMAASIEEVGIELGGAIGVTVLGSILAGVYSKILVLPNEAALPAIFNDGIDEALVVARSLPADAARQMTGALHQAFDVAYFTALAVAAVLMVGVAVMSRRANGRLIAKSLTMPRDCSMSLAKMNGKESTEHTCNSRYSLDH